jgi:hypothetical protein
MTCKMCIERGKTWVGDDPKCAFETGPFSGYNWNCATMNALRDIADNVGLHHRDDMESGSFGAVPCSEGYIVMAWYKNRGKTGAALVIDENAGVSDLTEAVALAAIEEAKTWVSLL